MQQCAKIFENRFLLQIKKRQASGTGEEVVSTIMCVHIQYQMILLVMNSITQEDKGQRGEPGKDVSACIYCLITHYTKQANTQ